MNINSELLQHIYQTADMGVKSLTNLLNDIKEKDNKIKPIISEQLKGYEKILKESEKYLKKHKVEPKTKSIMADMMSKMGIKKEVNKDNSDSALAEMLMQGYLMGNTETEKKIELYKDSVDNDVISLAKELLKFGETSIDKIKKYL